jgi:hypothetical protein
VHSSETKEVLGEGKRLFTMKIILTPREIYFACIFSFLTIVVLVVIFRSKQSNDPSITVTPNVIGNWSLMPSEMVIIDDDPTKQIFWRDLTDDEVRLRRQNNTVWPATDAPPIIDQGHWGSCTAFSMRYAYMLWLKKRTPATPVIEPSTAFWYAKSRRRIFPGGRLQDTGSTTLANVLVVTSTGVPAEADWGYKARNIFSDPPATLTIPGRLVGLASSYTYSANGSFPGFKQLPIVSGASESKWKNQAEMFINEIDAGRVVMASIYAYSNLTPQVLVTGIWPPPGRSPIGGHAICLIGYVRGLTYESSVFTFFNSWGSYTGSFNQTGDGNIVSGGIPGLYCISFSYVANSKYSGDWWSL